MQLSSENLLNTLKCVHLYMTTVQHSLQWGLLHSVLGLLSKNLGTLHYNESLIILLLIAYL